MNSSRILVAQNGETMKSLIILIALMPATVLAAKPLFSSDEPIQAVLTAPITQVYRERKQKVRLYHEGVLSYKYGTDKTHRASVKVRTRGNFRRLNCAHPPLRLNFKKKDNDINLFERQDKLKLVGPCKNGEAYQDYVGLEYLVYKMWEALSPYHFKTRLIELSYLDSDKKRKPRQATTFVIEEIKDVAKRLKLKRVKQQKVKRQNMNLEQTALLELFQLLIGNTDYSTLAAPEGENCCHNARLLVASDTTSGIVPVPYDFDVSGFVDPPYATPAPQYPIKNVRQRYFTGWCKEESRFRGAIQTFQQQKAELYNLVNSATVIGDRSRQKATNYLNSFYTLLDNPDRVEREILNRCRGSVITG